MNSIRMLVLVLVLGLASQVHAFFPVVVLGGGGGQRNFDRGFAAGVRAAQGGNRGFGKFGGANQFDRGFAAGVRAAQGGGSRGGCR